MPRYSQLINKNKLSIKSVSANALKLNKKVLIICIVFLNLKIKMSIYFYRKLKALCQSSKSHYSEKILDYINIFFKESTMEPPKDLNFNKLIINLKAIFSRSSVKVLFIGKQVQIIN